jgi:hypothetical protein
MVVAIDATVQEIAEFGESFNWPACHCEKCSRNMWGHGFVGRYFEGYSRLIRIKRLICPGCGVVVVFRPKGFWARLRSPITEIFRVLTTRLASGFWPFGFIRQRGWSWLKKLMTAVVMSGKSNPLEFLKERFHKEVYFFA